MSTKPNPAGTKKDGTVYVIPPNKFDDVLIFEQVRFDSLDENWVEHMARKIAAKGQTDNLPARLVGPQIEIIDGRHRFAAIKRIHADPEKYGLPAGYSVGCSVKLFVLSDDEAYDMAVLQNVDALALRPMDLARSSAVWKNRGLGPTEIAARLSTPQKKFSASRVSQLLLLMDLPREEQELVHSGKLKESVARQIMRQAKSVAELKKMVGAVLSGEVNSAEVMASANEAKRAGGKVVKRTLHEILTELERRNEDGAVNFLNWCLGQLVTLPDDGVFVSGEDSD